MDEDERYRGGEQTRRAVLGDAYVDQALSKAAAFTEEFQRFITRYAWGEVWTRPGLGRRERSLVTVGILIALDRPDELRLHLRGALNNGVTREEIKEVLIQSAVYCGVPAANSAFRTAQAALAEIDAAT